MGQRKWTRRTGNPLEEFCNLAIERGGIFRARDVAETGWSRGWLRLYVGLNWLKQHGRGRYGLSHLDGPAWGIHAEAALRFPQYVFCLSSALWMHGLLETQPAEAWLALEYGARRPLVEDVAIRFAWMRMPPLPEEIRAGHVEGFPFRVYSRERALVDCLRLPRLVEPQLALHALRTALAHGKTNVVRLTSVAARLRAMGKLRRALEALEREAPRTIGPALAEAPDAPA